MKKIISLLGALFIIASLQTYAEKSKVIMQSNKTGNVNSSTTIHRSPMRIPADVYYDNELRQIEIYGDENLNAQIYLCDEDGNIIAYSSTVNTLFYIPDSYSGTLSIRIETDNWIAIGLITV